MNQNFRRLLKVLWIALCIVILATTLSKFDQRPDSDIADFLVWGMLVLTVPSGILAMLLYAGFAYALHNTFAVTVPTTYSTLSVTWLLYFVVGYVQWFYLLPRLVARMRRKQDR
jgi:hypothetical protein